MIQKTEKHYTDPRDNAVRVYRKTKSYRNNDKVLWLHPCTIGSIVRKWKEHGSTVNCLRTSGFGNICRCATRRIEKMVNKQVRIIRNELAKDFQSSLETVTHSSDSNTVQYHGFRSSTNVKSQRNHREITEKSDGD